MDGSGGGVPGPFELLARDVFLRCQVAGFDPREVGAAAAALAPRGALADPRPALTARQAALLELVRASVRERGYPPTLRELGRELAIRSTNGVSDHLRALARKGYLRVTDSAARGIRLLPPPTGSTP